MVGFVELRESRRRRLRRGMIIRSSSPEYGA
jgi:hypothetical protein